MGQSWQTIDMSSIIAKKLLLYLTSGKLTKNANKQSLHIKQVQYS